MSHILVKAALCMIKAGVEGSRADVSRDSQHIFSQTLHSSHYPIQVIFMHQIYNFVIKNVKPGECQVLTSCIWWGMFGCTYHMSPKDEHDITQKWRAIYKLSLSDKNCGFAYIIHTKYIDIIKYISTYVFQIQCPHNYIDRVWIVDWFVSVFHPLYMLCTPFVPCS